MKGKILVTARSFRDTAGPHQQMLKDAGYETVNSPYHRPLRASELALLVSDVVGTILGLDEVTAEVLGQAKELRVISRYGVGVDNVDIRAATARGIVVTITPGDNSVAVAELTMALMLALARRIPYHDRLVKQGGWVRGPAVELAGYCLGIIGMGRIGREVAKRAAAFGMRILYHDPVAPPQEFVPSLQAAYRPLEELLSESDVISLHLPLTDDTRNLIGTSALRRMKSSAFLINTARGGLVDEQALYGALAEGALAGAACDVFSQEPPIDNPLLGLDCFIATPHMGSATLQTTLRMGRMASENALAVLRGERPASVVNLEVYDRSIGRRLERK
jgi:D-3-phosphoglycerate dehydrogenase